MEASDSTDMASLKDISDDGVPLMVGEDAGIRVTALRGVCVTITTTIDTMTC